MISQERNCTICGEEFEENDLKPVALSTFQIAKYKICVGCISKSSPEDDYKEIKDMIKNFLKSDEKLK